MATENVDCEYCSIHRTRVRPAPHASISPPHFAHIHWNVADGRAGCDPCRDTARGLKLDSKRRVFLEQLAELEQLCGTGRECRGTVLAGGRVVQGSVRTSNGAEAR